MRLNFMKKYFVMILSCALFLIALKVNSTFNKPYLVISKQEKTWNLNDQMMQKFNLGFKRLVTSFLWVSTILESDIEHYKKKDMNSWMFLRFNTISVLDPKFYENYALGGPYLSIVKDDLFGASIIYDKGLKQFPNDFSLLRDAGFHYHFEVGDYVKSYTIYSELKEHPESNIFILSTLARLETNNGNLESAFKLLSLKYNETKDKDSFISKHIYSNLYSIKAEMDLNCLNTINQNCSKTDLAGVPYVENKGQYQATKKWELFRVKKVKK